MATLQAIALKITDEIKRFQKDILIKNMKKIKLNKRILNKVFNGIINTMIPESKDKIMPKGSDAINIKFL